MSEIFERMAANMPEWMDLREGSYAGDNLRAVACELERINAMGIEYMPNRFFPTLASGEDLTLAAENFGIIRKAAEKAQVTVTLTGVPGTAFREVKAAAGDIVFLVEDGVIGANGTAIAKAAAETAGTAGNVTAGAVNELISEYEGITGVTNTQSAWGGADREDDEALRKRVLVRWSSPSTGGNRADYISWALAVQGVAFARAFNPEGGKVEVYIVGEDTAPASEELLEKVRTELEEKRPLGAQVSVHAADAVDIAVGVKFTAMEGYDGEKLISDMRARLKEYIEECCFKSEAVSYLKIAGVLFTEGVADIEDYTLNGARESIAVGEREFARITEVTAI